MRIRHTLVFVATAVLTVARMAASAPQPVHIEFAAAVAGAPFACGQSYAGIGTTKSTITVSDLRFYVSSVSLLDAAGRATPVALTQDGMWQTGGVALLDFEDGRATCSNGTPETHRTIDGTVPAGAYTGMQFVLGLPFDVNHSDATRQPSPLNLSRLFWNWNAGYKFTRIDLKTTGKPQGWVLHLGSTNCQPSANPNAVPTRCAAENTPTVKVAPFNMETQAVRFDLASLLAKSDVNANAVDTPSGCMADLKDADCAGVFATLGLPFGRQPVGVQTAFSSAPKSGR